MLKSKDDALVVVGAGHLVGKSGVVEMLRAKGYTVEPDVAAAGRDGGVRVPTLRLARLFSKVLSLDGCELTSDSQTSGSAFEGWVGGVDPEFCRLPNYQRLT
jgi:hypothetical protein